MRRHLLAAAALVALALGNPAMARDIPATGLSVADVVAWLQAGGHPAEVITEGDGAQHVKTSVNGLNFSVYLFDCKQSLCGSVQFAEGWNTGGKQDPAKVAAWNRHKRWARAYLDDSNDPWLEMDVDITPGGTYELLNDDLATWGSVLGQFSDGFLTR